MTSPSTSGLLEWLTELRRMVHLLCPVYYKGYNSGTAKWKRCIGQGTMEVGGRWAELPCFLWGTPREALQTLLFRGFYGGFIYVGTIK